MVMARSSSWRRSCPDQLILRIEQALEARIYLLRETGPTGFLLKEDELDRCYKVCLGDPHTCSCPAFKREKELCIHILWVLVRKFRIPKDSSVVYQLGLVEREINEVIYGALLKKEKKKPTLAKDGDKSKNPKRKNIDDDDICPICHVELKQSKMKDELTYCKYGCGNNIHINCMKVWAEHQKSSGESVIKCPLCRSDFGPYKQLMKEFYKQRQHKKKDSDSDVHMGTRCRHCGISPIQGKCYRCEVCTNYVICFGCFSGNWHSEHGFQCKKTVNGTWKPVNRQKEVLLSLSLTNTLRPQRTAGVENSPEIFNERHSPLTIESTLSKGSPQSHSLRRTNSYARTAIPDQDIPPVNRTLGVSGMRLDPLLSRRTSEEVADNVDHFGSVAGEGHAPEPFLLADRLSERSTRTPKYLPPLSTSRGRRFGNKSGSVSSDVTRPNAPNFPEANFRSNSEERIPIRSNASASAESAMSRRHKVRPVLSRRNLSAEVLRTKVPSEPDLRSLNDVFQISGFTINR